MLKFCGKGSHHHNDKKKKTAITELASAEITET